MQDQWQAHLQTFNATFAEGRLSNFGQAEDEVKAAQSGNIMTALASLGHIEITGADTVDFLQGQFSNDVKQVSTSHSQLNAYCTPKGRILTTFRLFAMADHYYMTLPHELLEGTLKRLRMYVMRSQVTLNDISESWVSIGIAGPDSETHVAETLGEIPADINAVKTVKDIAIIRVPGVKPRFELHGPVDKMIAIWDQLAARLTLVGEGVWSHLDIEAGIPTIRAQTAEKFVPQMVNLQAIDGLSFKKGCFPGQEIVARTQYLGKLKKRMYRAHIDTQDTVQAGDELYGADENNKQSIGTIVEAQPSPRSGYDILAVIQITEAENKPVHLHKQDGALLEISELPYSLD